MTVGQLSIAKHARAGTPRDGRQNSASVARVSAEPGSACSTTTSKWCLPGTTSGPTVPAGRLPGPAYQMATIRRIPVLPIVQISTHYYFRFSALDRPGVLSTISGILGRHGISIQSVQQKGRKSDGAVPVVMLSHRAREADVQQALAEISALEVAAAKPMLIRIEDPNLVD